MAPVGQNVAHMRHDEHARPFLGEILTGPLFAGFALIFAGIVISEYLPLRAEKKRRARAMKPQEAETFPFEDDPEREA